MTPDDLFNIVEGNSRNAELTLRKAQQQSSEWAGEQLALEQEITLQLGKITILQLEQGTAHSTEVTCALQARQQAQDVLRQQLLTTEHNISRALAAKENLQTRFDNIEQSARAALEQDADYARQVEQLDLAQAAHREHISGYDDLRQECALKRQAYGANPLYTYLRTHAFGTDQYRRNRLNRAMDNWLANKVNYLANRENELSLIAMAERNEALQADREALLATLGNTVDAQLLTARNRLGDGALQLEADAQQGVIDQAKGLATAIQQQLAQYAQNEDPHYLRARQLLTAQLKTSSIGQLIDLAGQTPDDTDDLIVEQLQTLRSSLQSLQTRVADTQQNIRSYQDNYDQAKKLERKVRNAGFSGSDVTFDPRADVDRLIESYMKQDISLGYVIDQLNQARTVLRSSRANRPQGSFFASTSSSNTASFSTSQRSGGGSFNTTDSF